jgi:hypothetical protein
MLYTLSSLLIYNADFPRSHDIIRTLQVKGASVSSPYRLRPLVGVRVPLNSTYSPLIYMHNPHMTAIQVSKSIDT